MPNRKRLPNLNRIKIPTTINLDPKQSTSLKIYQNTLLFFSLINPKGLISIKEPTINVNWLDIYYWHIIKQLKLLEQVVV